MPCGMLFLKNKIKEKKKLILLIDFILYTFEILSFILPLKGIPSHFGLLFKICDKFPVEFSLLMSLLELSFSLETI